MPREARLFLHRLLCILLVPSKSSQHGDKFVYEHLLRFMHGDSEVWLPYQFQCLHTSLVRHAETTVRPPALLQYIDDTYEFA